MNEKKYKWILYVITFVIVCTITIQIYWNYKNYLSNKQQLINEVQLSLDNVVDNYYTQKAQKNTIGLFWESDKDNVSKTNSLDTIFKHLNFKTPHFDSIKVKNINGISIFKGLNADSVFNLKKQNEKDAQLFLKQNENNLDTEIDPITTLTNKIMISFNNDSLSVSKIDSILLNELQRKNIKIDYFISYENTKDTIQNINLDKIDLKQLSATSTSSFLPKKKYIKNSLF